MGVEAVGDKGAELIILWEGILASTCSLNDGGKGVDDGLGCMSR